MFSGAALKSAYEFFPVEVLPAYFEALPTDARQRSFTEGERAKAIDGDGNYLGDVVEDAAASIVPSGDQAMERIVLVCVPCNMAVQDQSATDDDRAHNRMVLSPPEDAKRLAFLGCHATDHTRSLCPFKVADRVSLRLPQVLMFHCFTKKKRENEKSHKSLTVRRTEKGKRGIF